VGGVSAIKGSQKAIWALLQLQHNSNRSTTNGLPDTEQRTLKSVLNDPYLSSTVPVPSIAESWSQIKLKHHRSSCIPQRQTRIILLPVRWIDSFVFARPPIVRPHPLPCPPYSSPMATRHGQISIIRVIRPSVMLSAESAAALPEASVRPVRQPAAHQPPLPWRHHRREFMSADTTLRPLLARGRHKSGPFGV